MAVNRTKVLEAAQKFLSKGQYDKAVAEYQKLVNEDPRDVRTLLKIGDLHTRRNKPKDAIDVYQKVADLYAKQGFFLKAVAVYKQILKLDPAHLDSMQKLAKMYEELALTSDALSTYEQVADTYVTQGQMPKALEVMERMIELDGQNVAVRIKHAEALSKANKSREAAQAFSAGAQLLKDQGRMDDYLRVVERQLYHDPDNVVIARELSRLYLERSDPKRALAKLQVCFKADPRDVQTLEMLAEAFRQLGQTAKTVSVLKEIARLHGEAGNEEPRRRTLRRVIDLDPNDAEVKQALSSLAPAAAVSGSASPKSLAAARPTAAPPRRPAAQPPQPPAPPPAPVIAAKAPPPRPTAQPSEPEEELELEEDIELVDESEQDDVLIIDEGAPQDEASVAAPHGGINRSLEERVLSLLSDADAREGAGDYEGAVAALQGLLDLDPSHVDAHERLKDIYIAADRRVDAVKELLWLSSSWEEHSHDRAVQYAEHAYRLAPRSEATRRRLAALDVPIPGELSKGRASSTGMRAVQDADAELDALLPPRAPAPPLASEPPPSDASVAESLPSPPPAAVAGAALSRAELLELPIRPEDFEERPPVARAGGLSREQAAELLEVELTPDEFAPRQGGFALPPPSRELPAPGGRGVRAPVRAEVPREPRPSMEFAPIGTNELSVELPRESRPPAAAAQSTQPPSAGRGLDSSDLNRTIASRDPRLEDARLEDERLEDDQLVDPTVRGELLPEILRAHGVEPSPSDIPPALEPESISLASEPPLMLPESILPPSEPPVAEPSVVQVAPDTEPPAHELIVPAVAREEPSEPPLTVSAESGAREVGASKTAVPVEIEEVLDEADFFASQGLLDEALELVQEAILIYPGSSALKQRLAEYEAKADQSEAEAERLPDSGDDESFEIAEQLANELVEVESPAENDDMIDVESVFAQFKKGVAEQIAPDDSDTHFDLGIAYKEMGLIEDAVSEFELAAKSRKRACTALTMVGMCHLERGNAPLAITYFERALQSDQRNPAEELALHYELGSVYEQTGQLAKALTAFEQVSSRDRSFRGVGARLEQLKKRGVKSAGAKG